MSFISQSLSAGHSAKKILEFILGENPEISSKVNAALQAGHSISHVLNFLEKSGTINSKKTSKRSQENIYVPASTRSLYQLDPGTEELVKVGKTVALSAAGAFAAARAIPYARTMLGLGEAAASNLPTEPSTPPSVPPPEGPETPPTPESPQAPTEIDKDLLGKAKFLFKRQKHLEDVNKAPLPLSPILQKELKIPKELADQLEAQVRAESPQMPTFEEGAEGNIAQGLTPEEIEKRKAFNALPKKKQMITSDGNIAELDSVTPNGMAKVTIDGKQRNIPEDHLIESPADEKDLGQMYEELIQKIPESERSGMINWAGYDETNKSLAFLSHHGALYTYEDIPEEFADRLKNAMFKAKTTGSNYVGEWTEGESSRGAGLSVLIKELQAYYGGKGKEYSRKFEMAHDLFAIPKSQVQARLKREAAEKKEAKAKKKKEENERKKSKSKKRKTL